MLHAADAVQSKHLSSWQAKQSVTDVRPDRRREQTDSQTDRQRDRQLNGRTHAVGLTRVIQWVELHLHRPPHTHTPASASVSASVSAPVAPLHMQWAHVWTPVENSSLDLFLSKCARAWWQLTIGKHCYTGYEYEYEPHCLGFCQSLAFVVCFGLLCVCVFVSYVSVDSFAAISATCQRQLGPLGQLGYGGGRGYASGGNASFRFEHNIFCQLKWCT